MLAANDWCVRSILSQPGRGRQGWRKRGTGTLPNPTSLVTLAKQPWPSTSPLFQQQKRTAKIRMSSQQTILGLLARSAILNSTFLQTNDKEFARRTSVSAMYPSQAISRNYTVHLSRYNLFSLWSDRDHHWHEEQTSCR